MLSASEPAVTPNPGRPFRRATRTVLALALVVTSTTAAFAETPLWQDVAGRAAGPGFASERFGVSEYRELLLDDDELRRRLAPLRAGTAEHVVLELPLPEGGDGRFRLRSAPVMEPALAAKFPDILTLAGQGLDDPTATVRVDVSSRGLNAILLTSGRTAFVAPEATPGSSLYASYDYRDLPPFQLEGDDLLGDRSLPPRGPEKAIPFSVGSQIRLYRAAISAAGEFTQNVGGASQAMAAIVTFVNQLNALWERDLAQRIVLVDRNDELIFTDPATDPFVDNPGIFDNGANFDANQLLIDTVIGSENYDIGHLMLWNSQGGVAQFSVCQATRKAKGQTGAGGSLNHLRTLAHEMGHQFYMNHTWNSQVCANVLFAGQHRPTSAYEPGSGNTIMSYQALCDDGMQDDNTGEAVFQYHSHSFDQTLTETIDGIHTCGTVVDLPNTPPVVSAGSSAFTFPHSTPFVLEGSATDAEGDLLTFSWEELDLPVAPAPPADGLVPFFRVFAPSESPRRVFPQMSDVISGTATQGEQLPSNAQTLNMRLVARDNHSGIGGVAYGLSTVSFDATAGPFAVTAPNTGAELWRPGTSENVTWNVASTDLAPVRCSQVDIDLSIDGGATYPISLAAASANDGSEAITVPSVASASARVRVRCSLQRNTADTADVTDHHFFDISNADFTVEPDTTGCVTSLVVSSTADSGACTLRDTLAAAASSSTITFDATLAGATLTLASEISIDGKTLVIDGGDRDITISGGGAVRLFRLPGTADVTFRRLTLADGLCTAASPCVAVSGFGDTAGGAVFVRFQNTTTLFDRVTFRGNEASFGGAVFNNYGEARYENSTFDNNLGIDGGALYARSTLSGGVGTRVTVDRTTFKNNRASDDGAGIFHDDGFLAIYNSTLSANVTDPFATRQGGAVHTDDRFNTNRVVLEITNSTLAGNSATEGGAIYLGASSPSLATATLTNVLLADSAAGGECVNAGATLVDGGSNLVEDDSCGFTGGADPELGPLGSNGGWTETHLPAAGSPAIDNGDDAVCASAAVGGVDQRGYGRPAMGCDIGAVETDGSAPAGAPTLPDQVFLVDEQAPIGTVVGTVAATDPDLPGQSLTFSLQGGNVDNAFALDPATGQLTVRRFQPLDPQLQPQFQLLVSVSDDGSPPLVDSGTVTVTVTDINRAPEADDLTLTVSSTAQNGAFFGFAVASDPDPGDRLTYAITGGNTGGAFSIDSVTGDLFVANNTGFGTEPSFSLTVEVTDDAAPTLSDTATLTINVRACVPVPNVVSSTADSGPCTLRQAVIDATSGATLTFSPGLLGATLTLADEIEIDGKTLVIDGENLGITISGGNSVRLFRLPGTADVTFRRLTLADGLCTAASPCTAVSGFGDRHGGAVFVRFSTTTTRFDRVTFRDNQADFGGAVFNNYGEARYERCTFEDNLGIDGGAAYVRSTFDGTSGTRVTFDRSTLENNRAFDDGAGLFHDDGHLFIHNSTLSGNFTDPFATRQGGALFSDDRFDTNRVAVDLVGSTLAGNSATEGGGLYLGASATNLTTVTLRNTLVADSPVGGDCLNAGATLVDGGSNLVEDNSCGFTGGADPLLAALADNGGDTETHALGVGSPALGAGNNAVCAAAEQGGVDQRGFGRDDGACDIGAFELGATPTGSAIAWDGGGATENWSEALNWEGDVVPTAADSVLFDGRSRKRARVDPAFAGTVTDLTLDGYLGDVVLERSLALAGSLDVGALGTLDLASHPLTVEVSVSNRGTLRQTLPATAVNATVRFLNLENQALTEIHYYGVDLTPTATSLGDVTVEVLGHQPRCTGGGNDPVASRCFDVSPQTPGEATLRFFYSEAERGDQFANQMKIWHFNAGASLWEPAGTSYERSESDLICVTAEGDGCWVETTGVNGFSPFALGSGNVPTAPSFVPVTLSFFEARRSAEGVSFRWSTTTETANVGFRLYAETGQGLRRFGEPLIPSKVLGALRRTDYTHESAFEPTGEELFYLEDVDARGVARRHGPFRLGKIYGSEETPFPTDWDTIRQRHQDLEQRRQRELTSRFRGALATGGQGGQIPVRLLVEQDGVYRVSFEDLLAAGFDFTGVPAAQLALVNKGQPVPRRFAGAGSFGAGGWIEFYGEALDTLYTKTNIYELRVDADLARPMPEDTTPPDEALTAATWYLESFEFERDRAYFTSSPGEDPWYDTWLHASSAAATAEFPFALDHLAPEGSGAELTLELWGVTAWPAVPDHHALAALNGAQVADSLFDGLTAHGVSAPLPPGLLEDGENLLTVTVPNDLGQRWDVVAVDRFSVRYPRHFVARQGGLAFAAAADRFTVHGVGPDASVYRLNAAGPTLLAGALDLPGSLIFADGFESADLTGWETPYAGPRDLSFPGTGEAARYVVASGASILRPVIEAGRPAVDINGGSADYVAIVHPDFLADLAPLVAAREAQGLDVKTVDVFDIYTQWGHGLFDPQAIDAYLEHAVLEMGASYVLLVGGDTYDYHDHLGLGAISFIPSLYAATGELVGWAPVDPLYADVDGDELPDVAIGRLPVRTPEELQILVQKTLDYEAKGDSGTDYGRTAIFAADDFDGRVDFSLDSELFEAYLPAGWQTQRAYVGTGVVEARQKLIDALEDGVALASFVGHSTSTRWTFDGLFGVADAAALGNSGRPTVVSQWGCWNNWYVSTEFDTLAHGFLVAGDRGAAAVLGATTLTDTRSERALGRRIMLRLAEPGTPLGDAVQAGKAELALTEPDLRDVLLGWTLLGDPALVVD